MVPHCTEGGNSLLLRAISSQNKNISFRRKSQINTGFAWSGFYLPKNCYFPLTSSAGWGMEVESWVKWVSCVHTHIQFHSPAPGRWGMQIPPLSFFSPPPPLSYSLTHTHKTYLMYIYSTYTCEYFILPQQTGCCFPRRLCISDIKGASWLLDEPVWRHHIVVSSFHINGVFTSFDKPKPRHLNKREKDNDE